MSVVVRMEMPNECPCELWYNCNPYAKYSMAILDASVERFPRPKPLCNGCRIICSIPEGHGRLVDADALDAAISDEIDESKWDNAGFTGYRVWSKVDEAPTIVPEEAERSET